MTTIGPVRVIAFAALCIWFGATLCAIAVGLPHVFASHTRPPPEPTVSFCANPDPDGFPQNAPCRDLYTWFTT